MTEQEKKGNDAIPQGWFNEFIEAEFYSEKEADIDFGKIKEIVLILALNGVEKKKWPTVDAWKKLFPGWFVESFRPEFTKKELDTMVIG